MACGMGMSMTEVILMLLRREEIGQVFMKMHLDIKDMRNIRFAIEEAVSNNLPDIARWLLKTSGYLSRAYSTTAALGGSKKRCKNFLTLL